MLMTRLATGVAFLALWGCSSGTGAVPPPPPEPGGPYAIDPNVAWSACRPQHPPLLLTEHGQSPELVWVGNGVLVVLQRLDLGANELVFVSASGQVGLREIVGGIQNPRIAWHPQRERGAVFADRGAHWLGSGARTEDEFVEVEMGCTSLDADLLATQTGYMVLVGNGAYCSHYPQLPLVYGLLPFEKGPIQWKQIASGGPWSRPWHTTDADGLGHWIVAKPWSTDAGILLRVEGQTLQVERPLEGTLPEGGRGDIEGLAEREGELFLLFRTRSPDKGQWVVQLTGSGPRQWQIAPGGTGTGGGSLLTLGRDLLVASSLIHPTFRFSVASFDPNAEPQLGRLLEIDTTDLSLARGQMVRTEEGFAVAWVRPHPEQEGNEILAQFFSCTVPP